MVSLIVHYWNGKKERLYIKNKTMLRKTKSNLKVMPGVIKTVQKGRFATKRKKQSSWWGVSTKRGYW